MYMIRYRGKRFPFYDFSFQNKPIIHPHIWIPSSPCSITQHSPFIACLSCVAAHSLPSFLSITRPEMRGTQALRADEDNRVSVLIEVVVVSAEKCLQTAESMRLHLTEWCGPTERQISKKLPRDIVPLSVSSALTMLSLSLSQVSSIFQVFRIGCHPLKTCN